VVIPVLENIFLRDWRARDVFYILYQKETFELGLHGTNFMAFNDDKFFETMQCRN
jgi:hypothetical protein